MCVVVAPLVADAGVHHGAVGDDALGVVLAADAAEAVRRVAATERARIYGDMADGAVIPECHRAAEVETSDVVELQILHLCPFCYNVDHAVGGVGQVAHVADGVALPVIRALEVVDVMPRFAAQADVRRLQGAVGRAAVVVAQFHEGQQLLGRAYLILAAALRQADDGERGGASAGVVALARDGHGGGACMGVVTI